MELRVQILHKLEVHLLGEIQEIESLDRTL